MNVALWGDTGHTQVGRFMSGERYSLQDFWRLSNRTKKTEIKGWHGRLSQPSYKCAVTGIGGGTCLSFDVSSPAEASDRSCCGP